MTKCDHKWTEQKHTGVESRCCHGCGSYEIELELEALYEKVLELQSQLDDADLVTQDAVGHARAAADGWQAKAESAEKKADDYQRDWYESKSEFGTAIAKLREEVRALSGSYEQAVAERDEARRALRNVQALALAKKLAKVYPEYADHLLRFCLEGGVTVEVLRDAEAVEASVKP